MIFFTYYPSVYHLLLNGRAHTQQIFPFSNKNLTHCDKNSKGKYYLNICYDKRDFKLIINFSHAENSINSVLRLLNLENKYLLGLISKKSKLIVTIVGKHEVLMLQT